MKERGERRGVKAGETQIRADGAVKMATGWLRKVTLILSLKKRAFIRLSRDSFL